MPTYDYKCLKGHITEKFVANVEESLRNQTCTRCGRVAKRVFPNPWNSYHPTRSRNEAKVSDSQTEMLP